METYTTPTRGTGLSSGLSSDVCGRHSTTAPVFASLSGTRLPIAGLAASAAADVDAATGPPSRGAPG